jgi:hypothetical protein
VATGTGSFVVALPGSCADAIRQTGPVTVTMSEPRVCGAGLVLTRMSWASSIETDSCSAAFYCAA